MGLDSKGKPYYITTAIAYTSGKPHVGNTYEILEEEYYFDATSSSKKDAKKSAAYDMLMYVLGYEEEDK